MLNGTKSAICIILSEMNIESNKKMVENIRVYFTLVFIFSRQNELAYLQVPSVEYLK